MTTEKPIREGDKMNRRAFLTKSVGCTAGLTLLAFPGIITEVLAAKGDKSKEELLKELEKKVDKFMPIYRGCSSTSFAALNEQFKLKGDNAIRALMPFAGGIAGKGETCGAVSGSILALGFFFASIDQKAKQQLPPSVMHGAVFMDRFKKAFTSTRCKEVVKHQFGRYFDFQNPEEQKQFVSVSMETGKCMEVIKKAVLIAGEIILENS